MIEQAFYRSVLTELEKLPFPTKDCTSRTMRAISQMPPEERDTEYVALVLGTKRMVFSALGSRGQQIPTTTDEQFETILGYQRSLAEQYVASEETRNRREDLIDPSKGYLKNLWELRTELPGMFRESRAQNKVRRKTIEKLLD